MGEAADDMFDVALREQDRLAALLRACPCRDPKWERDDETGLMHCIACDTWVDE